MIYAKDEKIQRENVVLEGIHICNSTSFWKATSVIPTMSRAEHSPDAEEHDKLCSGSFER